MIARRGAALTAVVMCIGFGCGSGGKPTQLRVIPGENFPVTANGILSPIAANSPDIAVDPRQPQFVAMAHRIDNPDFGCALDVSVDGGRLFRPADPVPALPDGSEKCYGPSIDFDGHGTLYYLFVALHGQGNQPIGAFLTISKDYARTFTVPRQILGPHNFGVRMAIDRRHRGSGRLVLAWLAANSDPGLASLPEPPNPVMSMYSDDGGRTFSRPTEVSEPGRRLVAAPALAVGPDNRVAVVFYDLGSDERDYHGLDGPSWTQPWSIVISSSSNGGRTFGGNVVVDADVVPTERVLLIFTMPPTSVVLGKGGSAFVAWNDARNGDSDVFIRKSVDLGRSWSPARRLNDDPLGDGLDQSQPRLSIAPNGRIDAVFYDRRDDMKNRATEVYFAYSIDGGRSFSANIKITSHDSAATLGPRYFNSPPGVVEYGLGPALFSTNSMAIAAWTDNHLDGEADYQDVFSSQVRLVRSK